MMMPGLSGIVHGIAQGAIWDARDWTRVSLIHDKSSIHYYYPMG